MSALVTGWVLKYSEAEGSTRLVLIVLADHASSDGTDSYPSVETIRVEARLKSRRTVQSALRTLEEEGAIQAVGEGPNGRTNYTVLMGGAQNMRGAQSTTEEGRNLQQGGAQSGVARVEPSLEPSEENRPPADALFVAKDLTEEVFELYRTRVPGKENSRLTRETRKLIEKAISERNVELVKRAIIGLSMSDHHIDGGWTALRYAIGKTKQTETVGDRIDMMAAKAPHNAAAPNGRITVEELLKPFTGYSREKVAGLMGDVRRVLFEPSDQNQRIADQAETWLREHAKIVVVERSGRQVVWGKA